jgi:hypothetical protein
MTRIEEILTAKSNKFLGQHPLFLFLFRLRTSGSTNLWFDEPSVRCAFVVEFFSEISRILVDL